MSVNSQLLGDLVSGLYYSHTFEDKFRIFDHHIQKLGLESCAYTFIPNAVSETALNYPPVFAKSDVFSESFLEQYVADRFDENDFTIRAIKENKLFPMDWHEWERSDYLSAQEKNVLRLAREAHDIKHGLSIPAMNEPIGIAGFSLTNTLKDKDFTLLKQENLETIELCSKAFHDIVFSRPYSYHEFIPESLRKLSDKERIVLDFVSKGRSMAELGRSREPISQRYGEKLLLKLKQKFGGVTTNELICYATQLHLI